MPAPGPEPWGPSVLFLVPHPSYTIGYQVLSVLPPKYFLNQFTTTFLHPQSSWQVQATVCWLAYATGSQLVLLPLTSLSLNHSPPSDQVYLFLWQKSNTVILLLKTLLGINSMALRMNLKLYDTMQRTLHDVVPTDLSSLISLSQLSPAACLALMSSLHWTTFTFLIKAQGCSPVVLLLFYSLCIECSFLSPPSLYTVF